MSVVKAGFINSTESHLLEMQDNILMEIIMKNLLMATVAAAVVFSAAPAFATFKYMGMGMDMEAAGETKESHMAYYNAMELDERSYFKGVCAIPYKNRTPQEQAWCNSINE
jgi:hypothetical protein